MATQLPIPEFFSADAAVIKADMIAFYEGLAGKKIYEADVEMFMINAFVYREVVLRNNANAAALQNLAAFAAFPMLDYLAQNVGIQQRNPAYKAKTKIEFTLTAAHPDMVIQAGTRVSHASGNPVFLVIEDTLVLNGTDVIEVDCEAEIAGSAANGFDIGSITVLLDSFTYFDSCTNVDATSGGSEEETDEQLRERIYLAPASFGIGGPLDAYKFFALSAHPSIIDVKVEGPEFGKAYPPAGTVAIYVLATVVPTPQSILDAVIARVDGEKSRPGTDTVEVQSAAAVNYTINIALTLYKGADDQFIIDQITTAINTYKTEKGVKLGSDIVREQIIALCMVDGVYKPNLIAPAADLTIENSEFGNCTAVTITVAGYTNG